VGWDDASSTKGGFGILCIGSEGIIFIVVDDVAIVDDVLPLRDCSLPIS
jgi:hypothetical protein